MPSKKRSASPSSKNISVGRDVVDSVLITGDHNIVNYFKGEYVSLKEHYVPPDSVFQRVRTEDFVGRDWLTVQVDAFLNDPQRKSGAFLLIGDAGVGKTSFMAHLVRERNYLHLFAEQVPGQAMLQRAIQSLGSQLVTRYQIDPYKDRDTLIQGTVFPDFLERLLRMAAGKLTGGEKIVIVCDALDEAGTFPDGNVFGLPNVLPDGVYLILSQRPVNVKLPNLEPLTVRLEAQGADNLEDMEKYLRTVAQRASVADQLRAKNYSDAFFIQTLKEKSLGVWMYLHYVIKEIEQGSRAPLELEALPTGLVGYYADFWGDWRMGRKGRGGGEKAWNALYAPLLTTLAAAQEAITIGTLIQWAEVDADEDEVTRLVAEEWRAFIEEKEVGTETRYKPYHLSFADFIAGRADHEKLPPAQKNLVRDLAKRTFKAHQRIVKVFESECNGQWEKLVEREYPRLHLSAHLNGAGEYETLRILLTEGDEKIKWAEAREQKEETYAGYLNDLSYMWAYAEREQNYALAIRCMLIENSIHSLAQNIPPELLAELGKSGLWSYARCLSAIREKTESPGDRSSSAGNKSSWKAESLILITPELSPLLFQEALSITREINDERWRAHALNNLAPHLGAELKIQALATACEIKDEYARAIALANLVPHLDLKLKAQALAVAREIKNDYDRANAFANLVPHLDRELKTEILVAACEIKNEHARAHALVNLAPYLDTELKTEMFAVAREIKFEYVRAYALTDIAPYLDTNLKTQALQEALLAARENKDERFLAETLASLALHLDSELKTKTLQEALSAARKITLEDDRARALLYLPLHLDPELKTQALAIARGIKGEDDHAHALAYLAPHLDAEVKIQALSAARKIKDEYDYVYTLMYIAPYLNTDHKNQVLQEALEAIHKINDKYARTIILGNLALHLDLEIKTQVLATAREIKDEYARIIVLANLAPLLNDELKTEVLIRAHKIDDERLLVNVLTALAPHLDPEVKTQALAVACEIKSEGYRTNALVALALHLDSSLKSQALAAASKIEDERLRVNVFEALVPNLNPELKTQAFAVAREIKEKDYRISALADFALHLDNDLKTQVLAAAREIEDEYTRAIALANLAPHLNVKFKTQALQEALEATHEIKYMDAHIRALAHLAPHLDVDLKTQAFMAARKIKNEQWRAHALSSLAPYLDADLKTQALQEALVAASEINNENNCARALAYLAPHLNPELQVTVLQYVVYISNAEPPNDALNQALNIWKEIKFTGLRENIFPFIKFISQKNRNNGMEFIGALIPALIHFSGEEIVPELYRAIQDTARWWP